MERRAKREAELGYAALIVTLKKTGQFIGSGGLQPVKDTPEVEIAYHYLPSAWGRGYATEAARAILEFGFKTIRLEEVVGLVFPENVASSRVLEKAGMWYVGQASYFGIDGLKKYSAKREAWSSRAT